ncbi:hypothetical protein Q7P37_006406 [Cladosporium fusiforme]
METLEDAAKPNATEEREEVKAIRARIVARLNAELVAAGKPPVLARMGDQSNEYPASDYARRVTVPANVPVDIIDKNDSGLETFRHYTAEEQHAIFEAMRMKVHAMSDETTRQTYTVYHSGPPTTHSVLPNANDEELLQEWAEKRGSPNDAELLMLGQYIGVDVWEIYDWCLQEKAYNMMIGDAFSRTKRTRKYGYVRYQAARVQTKWRRLLERLRKEVREAGGDQDLEKDQEADVTMKDVMSVMHPFIDQMD